eukprot:CAMPEP_0119122312 /NCGR_PEP_ID=MMETSP1310-20130426/2608_1 /TAXON_ID=464262 /ORGANISM="Genus nov. species nov., Strain RCC2339" /LENGTH=796 /DNA_ID=CAMNT_0007111951 /DNA_START=32 /DNA_END=2422 /DNA_ORIENTATION=+
MKAAIVLTIALVCAANAVEQVAEIAVEQEERGFFGGGVEGLPFFFSPPTPPRDCDTATGVVAADGYKEGQGDSKIIYVSTTGTDDNVCGKDVGAAACKTVTHAFELVNDLIADGQAVCLVIAEGTYFEAVEIDNPVSTRIKCDKGSASETVESSSEDGNGCIFRNPFNSIPDPEDYEEEQYLGIWTVDGPSGFAIQGISVVGSTYSGIVIEGNEYEFSSDTDDKNTEENVERAGVTLEWVRVDDCRYHGILISQSFDINVQYSRIINVAWFRYTEVQSTVAQNPNVVSLLCPLQYTTDFILPAGIHIVQSDLVLIIENSISQVTGPGVFFAAVEEGAIVKNTISDVFGAAILLASSGADIAANLIYYNVEEDLQTDSWTDSWIGGSQVIGISYLVYDFRSAISSFNIGDSTDVDQLNWLMQYRTPARVYNNYINTGCSAYVEYKVQQNTVTDFVPIPVTDSDITNITGTSWFFGNLVYLSKPGMYLNPQYFDFEGFVVSRFYKEGLNRTNDDGDTGDCPYAIFNNMFVQVWFDSNNAFYTRTDTVPPGNVYQDDNNIPDSDCNFFVNDPGHECVPKDTDESFDYNLYCFHAPVVREDLTRLNWNSIFHVMLDDDSTFIGTTNGYEDFQPGPNFQVFAIASDAPDGNMTQPIQNENCIPSEEDGFLFDPLVLTLTSVSAARGSTSSPSPNPSGQFGGLPVVDTDNEADSLTPSGEGPQPEGDASAGNPPSTSPVPPPSFVPTPTVAPTPPPPVTSPPPPSPPPPSPAPVTPPVDPPSSAGVLAPSVAVFLAIFAYLF